MGTSNEEKKIFIKNQIAPRVEIDSELEVYCNQLPFVIIYK